MSERETRTARLVDAYDLAPEVRHFVFEVPAGQRLVFQPGQFVSFHKEIEGKPIVRAYSIASAPDGDNRFELCLNRVPGGPFSSFLFEMHAGEEVVFKGPLGYFVLREPVRESIFVANGTGIAPIRSMICHLLRHGCRTRLQLLFGVRTKEALLYGEEFERLAAEHANFEFYPTLSREGPAWTGRRGRVQDHLDEILAGRTSVDAYICGLRDMVNAVRTQLAEKGLAKQSIVYERYD
jgi:ferredoxin-NADP reductase